MPEARLSMLGVFFALPSSFLNFNSSIVGIVKSANSRGDGVDGSTADGFGDLVERS